ncbi:hypothetical protein NDI39_29675 [Microcoleus sp. ZQ-A2]|jgi:hypothetical protein|nr:hypothetical protein [Microcoleus sp. FACHB-1]
MTFSTSAHPLPFYADGEAPLEILVEKWGTYLEMMERHEKFILLGVIATSLAYEDGESLDWHYKYAPPLFHVADCVPVRIDEDIVALEQLSLDNLLGLCEALVAQLRYTREVAS